MEKDVRYYGLTFDELLAAYLIWKFVPIIRNVLLGSDQNEVSPTDS